MLTNVGGDYSIQRVFWYPNSATKGIVVYYGNATYGTIREAIDNLNIEPFNETENTKQNAVLLGTIIIAGNGDFTQPNKYSIVPGGLFRSIGGSGGGGNIPTSRLFDLSDVDVVNQQDNDLLVYNVDTLKWESKKSLEGDYTISGSLNVTNVLSVTGSVIISGSLDISNANVGSSRYLHTEVSAGTTWTIIHNLGYDYPNVTVYDGATNKVMLPSDVTSIDANTTEVTFATPEYGYALVSVGGVTTASADRYLHTVTSTTGSWVIDHNMGYKYVNIDVYDENDEQLIPQKVTAVSVNTVQVDFATPTSGNAIITLGGPRSTSIFNQTGSYYTTQYNIGITGSLVVSGDVDASSFNTTSDRTLKTNLERIEGALDKIDQLNGYTFDWISDYSDDKTRQIGMIANEVHEVQPELISKRSIMLGGKEEEIMLLDYSKVTALLIEGIKELKDRVSKLENKRKRK